MTRLLSSLTLEILLPLLSEAGFIGRLPCPPGFLCMLWNPDLVPHSRMVRALPMEPRPQTLSITLYDLSCQEVR